MVSNIVLVVVDTLRSKNLPSYGYDKETTDFLNDKLTVQNYYSNSPWTVPAHATLFTGQLPSEHGTTTENTYFDSNNTLVDDLKNKGYVTIGLTENGLLSKELGFGMDYDLFGDAQTYWPNANSWNMIWEKDSEYESRIEKYFDFAKLLIRNRDSESIRSFFRYLKLKTMGEDYNPTYSRAALDKASEYLQSQEDTFLFLNLMPVHASYTFNEEQKTQFWPSASKEEIENISEFYTLSEYLDRDVKTEDLFKKREKLYNASISYTDSLLKRFYEEVPKDTIFIVVGDHGELIGEYEKQGVRLVDHHFGTFKELIEVPLFIYGKGLDINIDQNEEEVYDHRSLHHFIKGLAREKFNLEGKEMVQSEYFGKKGFNDQFGLETPEEYEELFKRKSFSIINSEFKFDMASDGDYLWASSAYTEENILEASRTPSKFVEKAEILYEWRVR